MSTSLFRSKAPIIMASCWLTSLLDAGGRCIGSRQSRQERGGFTLLQEQKPTVAGSKGSFGWYQWTGPRRRAYFA